MMKQNDIEKIRINKISEIKEKIKRNPEYLHPCNKERLDDMKNLGFESGYKFTCWMQQNSIMNDPTSIDDSNMEIRIRNAGCKNRKEYDNKNALKLGYKDVNERQREYYYNKGLSSPLSEYSNWSKYFGEYIVENYIIETFEGAMKMPPNNKGFDWLCKRGEKIQNKARCLDGERWHFSIRYNNIADWFVLSGWDNKNSLQPLHVWIFHKDEIIRGRKFWRREALNITNLTYKLEEFEKYEVTNRLEKLKYICKERR